MRKDISFPRMEGTVSRQAHTDLPQGSFEREAGREGFFGPATHFYHANPPTGWSDWNGPVRPRAFDTNDLESLGESPWDASSLLGNASVQVRRWTCASNMNHLVRNGDGDELIFIHAGSGDLYCDYGHLSFSEGDYIVLPRGTNWRVEISEAVTALLVEATGGAYSLPDRGIMGDHAVFDPAILDTPVMDDAFRAQQDNQSWRVVMKRGGTLNTITYPYNPLDAVGWKGNSLVVRLNWRDIRPLMSHRYHVPPSAHSTFVANGFVVCTFVPRPIESDPGALKVPFYHSNDDYDEVIFYHQGEFFSRDNIHPGMITMHPCGFPHGPHPKAAQKGMDASRKETDEVAVMIDTRDALQVTPEAESIEWTDYVNSWKVKE